MMDKRKALRFIENVQLDYWDDLVEALGAARGHGWSIACDNAEEGIVEAARLVGPSPSEEVPYPLVRGGVYQAILDDAQVKYEVPADFEELDAAMAEHCLVGQAAVDRYAKALEQRAAMRRR
jgi:hypothetical protein